MLLTTQRLTLRPVRNEDAVKVFEYRRDAETNKYQGWIPESAEDADEFISKTADVMNTPGTWFQYVIILKESGDIIGDAGIHFMDDGMQAELGITLDKQFHRNGYAAETLSAIIDYLFTVLGKHRITASVDPENQGSIRLLERLGFRKEAHFVQSLFLNGKWVDDVVYALLEKEWID